MEEETRNLFKVHQTVRKMLKKRRYIVPDDDMTFQKFKTKIDSGMRRADMSFMAEKEGASSAEAGLGSEGLGGGDKIDKIYVFIAEESRLYKTG